MKYIVSVAVDGRIDIEVEADSFAAAKEKAMEDFAFTNLDYMDIVGFQAVNAESETGEFRDY